MADPVKPAPFWAELSETTPPSRVPVHMADESFCRELEATVGLRRAQWRRLRRRTMSSSGNGDGPADRRVTRGGRGVGHLDASLEIAVPAPIERRGAGEKLRGNPPVSALGYMTAHGTARIDDPELKHQSAAIEDFCAREGWELVMLVRDIQPETGRALNRPALSYAIERLGRGDASALVVAELGRLCGSVAQLREILDALLGADARLVSLEPEIDTGTEFGRAAARVVSAVSEWERARRAERTRKGLAAARAQGAVRSAIKPELKRRIVRMRAAGLTLQAIADELNKEGIPTARGGTKWRPSSVQAALGYKRPTHLRPRGKEQRQKRESVTCGSRDRLIGETTPDMRRTANRPRPTACNSGLSVASVGKESGDAQASYRA